MPHPVTSEQINNHLIAIGWNVDRAYPHRYEEHLQALARVDRGELIRASFNIRVRAGEVASEEVDSEGYEESQGFIPYPHDANSERERQGLVAFVRKTVEEARELLGSAPLSEDRRQSCC